MVYYLYYVATFFINGLVYVTVNEACSRRANLNKDKRILKLPLFMKKVYN